MPVAAGSRLGPYEILSPLGAGGMGEVWRARDPRLGREVAIKVLPASFSTDTDRLRRFEQEARAAGLLNHPNITAVYDIGTHDGAPYVVQELLEGETLRSLLAGGRLAPRRAIDFGREIARGLAAAHERGIVHRDLKPENVFVTRDGRVKILDFGLAKLTQTEAGPEVSSLPTATAGTEPGVVLGTLGYMSPEQVRGKPADARSDIFSFGAILYEMLSGVRAFHGDSAADTMSAILREDPPDLSVTSQNVSPGLERIVRHCLEKNPEQRFHSAHDLAFDLEALSTLSTAPPSAITTERVRSPVLRRWGIPVGIATALILAFLAGGWLRSDSGWKKAPNFRRLTFRRGNVLTARFASDGQTVVYGAAWEGKSSELFSVRTDSTESRPLGLDQANAQAISSKGDLAILIRKGTFLVPAMGTLARMPLGGGAPRELLEEVEYADWAPNGEDLAVVRRTPDGKNRLEYPIGNALMESFFLGQIRVSPTGDLVAFVEYSADNRVAINLIDKKGKKRALTGSWRLFRGLAWSSVNNELFFIAGKKPGADALRAVNLSGRERVLLPSGGALILHDVASDGRLLVERTTSHGGLLCLPPGDSRERELGWLDRSSLRDLSEDGRTILFGEYGEGGGGVFLRRTDGSPAVRLGDGDPQNLSSDGKWALALTSSEPPELLLLPTGPGAPKKVPIEGIVPLGAALLRDGKQIAIFHSAPGEPPRLSLVGVEGGRPKPVPAPGITATGGVAFSPDSKFVAYTRTDHRVQIVPFAGGPARTVPGEGLEPGEYLRGWSADGRLLFTQREGQVPVKTFRLDVETGLKVPWKEIQPADATGLIRINAVRATPDSRAYAYSYLRVDTSDLFVVEGIR